MHRDKTCLRIYIHTSAFKGGVDLVLVFGKLQQLRTGHQFPDSSPSLRIHA